MIPRYREQSETVEIHSHKHNECTHELENGWECCCSECRCETIITVHSEWAYDEEGGHKVLIKLNPGQYVNHLGILTPNAARALASALCFAANDAETLDREYPS